MRTTWRDNFCFFCCSDRRNQVEQKINYGDKDQALEQKLNYFITQTDEELKMAAQNTDTLAARRTAAQNRRALEALRTAAQNTHTLLVNWRTCRGTCENKPEDKDNKPSIPDFLTKKIDKFNGLTFFLLDACYKELVVINQPGFVMSERLSEKIEFLNDVTHFYLFVIQQINFIFASRDNIRGSEDIDQLSNQISGRRELALIHMEILKEASGHTTFFFLNRLALNLIITATALYCAFIFSTFFSISSLMTLAVGVAIGTLLGFTLFFIPFPSPSQKISYIVENLFETVSNLLNVGSRHFLIDIEAIQAGRHLVQRGTI